ncbi:MAG: putative selenium-dependent molybdenum hydroxylase system protein, YqeB family, partial [Streblomastix strix]
NKAQTNPGLAPLVVGLGPGFNAPNDVDVIIETNRGHDLGRLIFDGQAAPDTGIPGIINGETIKRVLRAPKAGVLHCVAHIGDIVNEGQTVALINNEFPVISQLSGFIRGMAGEGLEVTEGLKIGDVDPREKESVDATRISDKARNLSGAVLEVLVRHFNRCLPDYVYSRKIKELK